jgi:hypothetical protein
VSAERERARAARQEALDVQQVQACLEADVSVRLRAQRAREVRACVRKGVVVEEAGAQGREAQLAARVRKGGAHDGLVQIGLQQEMHPDDFSVQGDL